MNRLARVVALSTVALVLLIASTAHGAEAPSADTAAVTVPKVVGMRMDRATRTLRDRGLRVNEECGGLFGCIQKSGWWICHQSPRAGKRVQRYSVVVIYGERRGEC